MDTLGTDAFQNLRPLSLLNESNRCDSIHLQVFSNSVSWSIYLEQGKIIYASHSVAPFDRLDCHLRRLNHQSPITKLTEVRSHLRQMSLKLETQSANQVVSDYEAIVWLVRQEYLTFNQASILIEKIVDEIIELFLLLKKGTYKLGVKLNIKPVFCRLEVQSIVERCQKQLQSWQALEPYIWSPYQRPYFLSQNKAQNHLLPETKQKLSAILKGFSFYHLSVLLNQDRFYLAQSLSQYVKDGAVLLHDPAPPFNQLPKMFIPRKNSLEMGTVSHAQTPINSVTPTEMVGFEETYSSPTTLTKGTHKIVCVDDSPTMLKQINHFLSDDNFSVFPINDPVKALMQIIRVKPDLILLDIGMPNLDGYELCRLLRNHSRFKSTPIIMVTGSTGILDRVRAKFVGSSGYLTKPFDKANLLKTMFKHLA